MDECLGIDLKLHAGKLFPQLMPLAPAAPYTVTHSRADLFLLYSTYGVAG
jgi:hypothetical protein